MPVSFEEFEEVAAVNSEIRFITLELMRIAAQSGKPFDQVLAEFKKNAFKARSFLTNPHAPRAHHSPVRNCLKHKKH